MTDNDNNMTSAQTEENTSLNDSDKISAKKANDDNFSAQDVAYFVYEVIIVIATLIFIIYYSYIAYTQNLDDFAIFKEIIIGTVKLIILGFLLLRIIIKIATMIDNHNKNNN